MPRFRFPVLFLTLCLGGTLPAGVGGQAPLALEAGEDGGGVRASLGPVVTQPGIRSSLDAGLPVRIEVVVELWRDRFIDRQVGRQEWRASVLYDPLERRYRILVGDEDARFTSSVEEAEALLSQSLRVELGPPEPGRYYSLGRIHVETLSLSDLDELRRWLQGDLAPAMEGEGGVSSALGRGLQRILVRALGLPAERYQARTRTFRHRD